MKIVFAMAGNGHRFQKKGHQGPKPLINIEGRPMVEHISKMFPNESDVIFICQPEHLNNTNMREVLEKMAPGCKIVEAEPKLGPVYATTKALDLIDDEEPVMVTYCDCAMHWDYEDFKKKIVDADVDGCLVSFKGFHPPHSTGDCNYAYMRDEDGKVLEVREKVPFSEDKNADFASSGNYYFKKGKYIKKYFQELMDLGLTYNDEYYVSLVYNLLIRDGLNVSVYEGDKLLSFGTPEEVQDYEYWAEHFKQEQGFVPQEQKDLQVLIPMAGEGSRFKKQGYKVIKPFIDVAGEEMVVRSVKSFPRGNKYVFVYQKKHTEEEKLKQMLDSKLNIDSILIGLDQVTKGGVQTCLKSEKYLDPEKPLFIGNCDGAIVYDQEKFNSLVQDKSIDCLVFTFKGYPPASHNPESYGWVKQQDGVVQGVSVKIPISDDPINDSGIISCFWFRKAGDFLKAGHDYANASNDGKEYHIEGVLNFFKGKAVVFDVQRFIPFGTPEQLKTWEYWKDYFNKR